MSVFSGWESGPPDTGRTPMSLAILVAAMNEE